VLLFFVLAVRHEGWPSPGDDLLKKQGAVPFGQINACGGSPALVKVQPSLLNF